MDDILEGYHMELADLCTELATGIARLGKMREGDVARNQKIAYLSGRLQRAKVVCRQYRKDLRDVDKAIAETHQRNLKTHNITINKLFSDFESAQLIGAETASTDVDKMTSDGVLKVAADTQQESLKSVDRMLATVETTKKVGAETLSRLSQQTEALFRTLDEMNEMQAMLKIGSKRLRSFARRLVTDKIIMCFIGLIIALGVAAVVVTVI